MAEMTAAASGGRPPGSMTLGHLFFHNGAQLLGLTGLAVAQPVLDLLGRNPTYFVATGLANGEIVALAVLLTLGLPALLLLVEVVVARIDARAGRLLHLVLMGLLGALLGAGLARHVAAGSDLLTVTLAVAVGGAIVFGLVRSAAVALGLRYLALAPLLVLGSFLLASETSSLLFGNEAEAATSVTIETPAPIVVLQLDELPLASIMRSDGTLNEARFPGFARLAAGSTWYRNATTVSSGTTRSVPSLLSGTVSDSEVPTSAEYPDNLFTLLGESYELNVHEAVARLCPTSLCPTSATATAEAGLGSALTDTALVFGHVVLPPGLRSSLAPVDRSWGDFFGQEDVATAEDEPAWSIDEDAVDPQVRGRELDAWIERFPAETEGTLSYAHVLLPHTPWLMTASGLPLTDPGPEPGIDETGRWSTDPVLVREGLRMHLMQVQYVDGRIEAMMDRLQALGTWDDALVVVVADHGEAFTPGQPGRVPVEGTEAEIFSVPLFVKYPGQTAGEVSDINALTIDVLPTVVDALGVDTDWSFDGRSLLDPAERPVEKTVAPNELLRPVYVDSVFPVSARNEAWLPGLLDERGLAPVDPYADLVGQPVEALDVRGETPMRWQTFEPVEDHTADSATIPLVQVGALLDVEGTPPTAGLFVVNGQVAGVALAFACEGTTCTFRGLLDEAALAPRDNQMDLLLPDPDTPGAFRRAQYQRMAGR